MVKVWLYVEGSGDSKLLHTVCRRGFSEFLRKAETKSAYGKGEHSFLLLAQIDPAKVMQASGWADRLVKRLKQLLEC